MPEFEMPHGDAPDWRALDDFTQGYIEALFFTNTGTGDDDDLADVTFADLAPETLQGIKADCAAFQRANDVYLGDDGKVYLA